MKDYKLKIIPVILYVIMFTTSIFAGNWPIFRGDIIRTGFSQETIGAKFTPKWDLDLGEPIFNSPTMAGGKVSIGTSSGKILLLSAQDGYPIWEVQTANSVEGSPILEGNRVFAASIDKSIYGIDKNSGEVLWSYKTKGWIESSPLPIGGMVLVPSEDRRLYALNEDTGELLWSFQTGGDIWAPPAYSDGVVYFGCDDDTAYAVDLAGNLVWKKYLMGASYAAPVITDEKVIFVTVGNNTGYCHNRIIALNKSDGTSLWEHNFDNEYDLLYSSPAVGYGMLFYATYYSNFGALDLLDGSLIWEVEGDTYPLYSSPVLVDGMLLLGSYNGAMRIFDPFSGRLMSTYQADSVIHSSPALSNGVLVFGSLDNHLYALDISSDLNVKIVSYAAEVHQGESLPVELMVINSGNQSKIFDAWIDVIGSNGNPRRIAEYSNINIPPDDTLGVQIGISVPSNAPSGGYAMNFEIGNLQSDLIDFNGFRFKVISASDDITVANQNDSWNIINISGLNEYIEENPSAAAPTAFTLNQNYPNPFNSSTDIKYYLPIGCYVRLEVFDLLGRKVSKVVGGYQSAGFKNVIWNGVGDNGKVLSSGIYFYRLTAGDYTKTAKMVLEK